MKRAGAGRSSMKSLLAFEAIYKMGGVLLCAPLLAGAFSLLMKANGYTYLTHENITVFLTRPLTIFIFAALLVLGALYVLTDVAAVLFALDQARQGAAVTPGQICRFAVRNTARACRRENILLVPMALLLLPLSCAGFLACFLAAVSIPPVIPRYLRAHPMVPVLAAAVLAAATALAVLWLYTVHCFTVEGGTFSRARKRAAVLGRGKRLRDFCVLLLGQAAFAAAGGILLMAAMGAAALLGRFFGKVLGLDWVGAFSPWLAILLALGVIAGLSVPVGCGCAGLLYGRRVSAAGGPAARTVAPEQRAGRARFGRPVLALVICVLAAGTVALGVLLGAGGINPEIEYLRTTQVTAHRGASAFYPENTMAAFIGARDLGADWIELDVQQSRDGRLVVSHDANLKRTTGVDAYVWELTYDEIAALDAGRSFGGAYAGERIPLLEDVLAFAKENDMKLNIELKPTGRETALEKSVVDAIRAAEMEDACVVTSQVYEALERVKAYDATVPTAYVMRLAYGSIEKLTAADSFSVAAEGVTRALVSRVHNAGRELYVWTVNTRKAIDKMIELGVDNIITDDVDLVKQCVYESRYSELTEDYVDLLQSEPEE